MDLQASAQTWQLFIKYIHTLEKISIRTFRLIFIVAQKISYKLSEILLLQVTL